MLFASATAVADRVPYTRTLDLEARNGDLVVRHHHDWSHVMQASDGPVVRYTLAEPFGVGNDYSHVSAYSAADETLLWRVPSPPLAWMNISADGRYIIGLSNVKLANMTQLVVFAIDGRLIGRSAVSESSCVPQATRDALLAKQPPEERRVWNEFSAPACLANASNFSESVTNYIHWYHEDDPAPRIIEETGRVVGVELRDPKGRRFKIKFP